jgi:hypothetical protein
MRGGGLPYAVCAYCQTVIARDGMAEVGKAATLPEDVSPLQLGVGGALDGVRFSIVGRVRWGWADGSWNEWLMQLSDGTTRWLGEAMGQFQVLTERGDVAGQLSGAIRLGDVLEVDGHRLVASDVKEVTCLGGEGDLPFPTPADWTMTSVDFRSPDGAALSVQRDAAGVSAYVGRYVELAELSPSRLRQLEGWALPEMLRDSGR